MYRQTQPLKTRPIPDGSNKLQDNPRKGMPWLSEEKDLLIHLRRDRGLPWSGVTRIFSEQIPRKKSGIHASVLEPESQERLLAILSLYGPPRVICAVDVYLLRWVLYCPVSVMSIGRVL